MGAWVAGCTGLTVSVSNDNKSFREVAAKEFPVEMDSRKKAVANYEVTFEPVKARYVKVLIKRTPPCPKDIREKEEHLSCLSMRLKWNKATYQKR